MTPKRMEVARAFAIEMDVFRDLLNRVAEGGDDVAGRGEMGELKSSPEFYRMIADEFMEFATLYPDHAGNALKGVLRMTEGLPAIREETKKRRAALKKAGVL